MREGLAIFLGPAATLSLASGKAAGLSVTHGLPATRDQISFKLSSSSYLGFSFLKKTSEDLRLKYERKGNVRCVH